MIEVKVAAKETVKLSFGGNHGWQLHEYVLDEEKLAIASRHEEKIRVQERIAESQQKIIEGQIARMADLEKTIEQTYRAAHLDCKESKEIKRLLSEECRLTEELDRLRAKYNGTEVARQMAEGTNESLLAQIEKMKCGPGCCATILRLKEENDQLKRDWERIKDAHNDRVQENERLRLKLKEAHGTTARLVSSIPGEVPGPFYVLDADLVERIKSIVGVMKPEWRPIETAPKDASTVLLYNRERIESYVVGWYVEKGEGFCSGSGLLHPQPTHWMPLPEAPK